MKSRIKLSQWAKLNNYTYTGALRIYNLGQIPGASKTASGSILVDVIEEQKHEKPDHVVVYARVSSSENKSNLDSQAERVAAFCNANGWVVDEIIKECGSGLNDKRPKLMKLLASGIATRIVVEHKDRLTRFGFEYINLLCQAEIVIINKTEANSENEVMEDFASLVTSFCSRLYGRRCTKRKTEKLIKELESD